MGHIARIGQCLENRNFVAERHPLLSGARKFQHEGAVEAEGDVVRTVIERRRHPLDWDVSPRNLKSLTLR